MKKTNCSWATSCSTVLSSLCCRKKKIDRKNQPAGETPQTGVWDCALTLGVGGFWGLDSGLKACDSHLDLLSVSRRPLSWQPGTWQPSWTFTEEKRNVPVTQWWKEWKCGRRSWQALCLKQAELETLHTVERLLASDQDSKSCSHSFHHRRICSTACCTSVQYISTDRLVHGTFLCHWNEQ